MELCLQKKKLDGLKALLGHLSHATMLIMHRKGVPTLFFCSYCSWFNPTIGGQHSCVNGTGPHLSHNSCLRFMFCLKHQAPLAVEIILSPLAGTSCSGQLLGQIIISQRKSFSQLSFQWHYGTGNGREHMFAFTVII